MNGPIFPDSARLSDSGETSSGEAPPADRRSPHPLSASAPAGEPIGCRHCGIYPICLPLGLDQADMSLLDSIVSRKRLYKRGETLFRPGQRFDRVYAIRGGSVKTCIFTEDGREQVTGFYIAGELLGLSALVGGQYACEARALEPTSVCELTADGIDEIARRFPAIQHEVLKIMSGQIRHDEDLLLLVSKRSAEERLATYLVGLSRRFARRNLPSAHFRLSMSRRDIGNYLGIAEETICRLFSRFQEEKLLTAERRYIYLDDLKRLESMARVLPTAWPASATLLP